VTGSYALTADSLDYAWTRRPLKNTVANQPLASDKHAGSDAFFRTGRDGHPGGINVQFTATYHKLGAFLDRLERATLFIRVDQLELSDPAKDTGEASIRLTVSTLYVPSLAPGGEASPHGRAAESQT
jgi:hypothetical protein